MERLAMLIDETEKALKDCSMGARGLYLTLHLMAHRKNGDDIHNGRPELLGKEVSPRLLSMFWDFKPNAKEFSGYLAELERANLWKDGQLTSFAEDNSPCLKIRAANRERKGMKYKGNSGENQVVRGGIQVESTSKSGADKTVQDSIVKEETGLPPGDVKDPFGVWFFNHFRHCMNGKRPRQPQENDAARFEKKHSRAKLHVAMTDVLGSGYGWGTQGANIKKHLDGKWDKKPGAREAPIMQDKSVTCKAEGCGKQAGMVSEFGEYEVFRCECGWEAQLEKLEPQPRREPEEKKDRRP